MALLGRRLESLAAAALLLCGGGCSEQASQGAYRLEVYDGPVQCDAQQGSCKDADGQPVVAERLTGVAYVSRLASQYTPDGLYVYLEFQRASGVAGLLELDLPYLRDSAATLLPRLHYLEMKDGQVIFRSSRAAGRVELPRGADCFCQDGRLELLFVDFGKDGTEGTDDDALRRLSRSQFSRTSTFCRSPGTLAVGDGLQLASLPCPSWATGSADPANGASESDPAVDTEIGCQVDPVAVDEQGQWDDVVDSEGEGGGQEGESTGGEGEGTPAEGEDAAVDSSSEGDSGCGGDTVQDSTDEPSDYSGGDCSGSSSDSSSSDSSGDCSGGSDSTSSSSSASGCSGGSGGSGCEADAAAAVPGAAGTRPAQLHSGMRRPYPAHHNARHGHDPSLQLLLAGLLVAFVRRRLGSGPP